MAHVERRTKNKWRARYRGPDGMERSRTFTTKRDAQQWVDSMQVAKVRGVWIDPSLGRQSFSDYAQSWVLGRGHVVPGTLIKEKGHIANHLLPAFGSRQLSSIQSADVRAWIATMECKPGTIAAMFGTLRGIMGTASRDGVIGRNPCDGVDLPRQSAQEEMLFLDPDEIERLAAAIDPRYRALIYLAAYGGLRWGEIAALRPESLNLLRGAVDVRMSLAEVSGHFYDQPPKSGKPRTVSIPRSLAELIGEHMALWPNEAGTVFASPNGSRLRRSLWYRRFYKPAVLAAGLNPRLRFHDLRHTAAALAIAQSAHPKSIQERLGHSSIRITLDRYGHLFPHLDESMQQGLDEMLVKAAAASPRPGTQNVLPLKAVQRPRKGR